MPSVPRPHRPDHTSTIRHKDETIGDRSGVLPVLHRVRDRAFPSVSMKLVHGGLRQDAR